MPILKIFLANVKKIIDICMFVILKTAIHMNKLQTAYQGFVTFCKHYKKTIIGVLIFFAFLVFYCNFVDGLYSAILTEEVKQSINKISEQIVQNTWVNALLTIYIILVMIYWFYKETNDRDCRQWLFLVILASLLILWYRNPFCFLRSFFYINYRLFVTILLLILFIGKIAVLYYHRRNEKKATKKKIQYHGFIVDKLESIKDESIRKYAIDFINQLLSTDLSDGSFAVGITGEWGSGKTSFLKLLKDEFKGKADVIEFNPWMCKSPEQITNDFFNSLRLQLSDKHSRLRRPIKDYSNFLNEASSFSTVLGYITKFSLSMPSEDSLQEKRNHISGLFKKMDRPVVILMDDLDRLESDEVFEVLRLIRNTADFSNVIYIAAYDKEYIMSILSDKNIENTSYYLEKIFKLELHQPKVEKYQLYDMLQDTMKEQSGNNDKMVSGLLERIDNDQRDLILSILNNYRRVRNFTRRFMFNLEYIQEHFTNELKFKDLMWLELLEMSDKSTYEQLHEAPDKFLEIVNNQYKLDKKRITNKPESTKLLLEQLFGQEQDVLQVSMIFRENFDNYLSLRVSDKKLSRNQFINIFDCDVDIAQIVKEWKEKKKRISSISFQFSSYINGNQIESIEESKSFLMAALEVIHIWKKSNFLVFLNKSHYNGKHLIQLRQETLNWFEQNMYSDPVFFAKVLNKLYAHTNIEYDYEYDNRINESTREIYLLSNSDIIELLRSIMRHFLTNNPQIDLISLFDDKSEMGQLFKATCVLKSYDGRFDECYWDSVAFEIVEDHFSRNPSHSKEELINAYRSMFPIGDCPSNDPEEQCDYYNYAEERRDHEFEEYFGSKDTWNRMQKLFERCSKKKE